VPSYRNTSSQSQSSAVGAALLLPAQLGTALRGRGHGLGSRSGLGCGRLALGHHVHGNVGGLEGGGEGGRGRAGRQWVRAPWSVPETKPPVLGGGGGGGGEGGEMRAETAQPTQWNGNAVCVTESSSDNSRRAHNRDPVMRVFLSRPATEGDGPRHPWSACCVCPNTFTEATCTCASNTSARRQAQWPTHRLGQQRSSVCDQTGK
jgi:hypothetical protein